MQVGQKLYRPDPAGPVHAYKTYEILSPVDSHTREASCAEVECQATRHGWKMPIDEATDLGQKQAHYIRRVAGRSFTEARGEHGLTVFTFPAGEECFEPHRVPLDREPLYIVRGGDHRGNPTGSRRLHDKADHWVEDFAEHQDGIAERVRQG